MINCLYFSIICFVFKLFVSLKFVIGLNELLCLRSKEHKPTKKEIMKRVVLSFAILATISLSTFANTSRNKDGHGRGKSPMKELNLTAEQQEKLKTLNQDYRSKQKDLADSHKSDVNAILTPEQQAQWKEARGNKMRDRKLNHKGLAHKGKGKDAKWDAETSSKLETLRETFRNDKKTIELTRVSPEEQNRRIDELRTKYKADRREIIKTAKQSDIKG